MKIIYLTLLFTSLSGCIQVKKNKSRSTTSDNPVLTSKLILGEMIFSDENFSLDRTMSCATCHNSNQAFIDTRENIFNSAVSIGQDGISVGDRNSPTITYVKYIPELTLTDGVYTGGLFANGSSSNHIDQAKVPFRSPLEMQMPSVESVIERIKENSVYVQAFQNLYGEDILNNEENAFEALAEVITVFEKSDALSPFDSPFDQENLTAQELRGQALFKSSNCNQCHDDTAPQPKFTTYAYFNLGIPVNEAVRAENEFIIDQGLFDNLAVTDTAQRGKFRISSLRNVAVTAPYMHNGVFNELKTVVHFYNTRDVAGAINPETGSPWNPPEITDNLVAPEEGATGIGNLGLTDDEEDDIVAFLKALTDSQYEHLN